MSNDHSTGPMSKQLKTFTENHSGVIIFDKSEPRSVYNLVPPIMQAAMEEIDPKFYEFRFTTLEKHLRPDIRDYQLRVSFWREYNHTQDNWKRSISLHAVTKGICSAPYLYNQVFKDPLRLAFILFPVTDLQASMHEMEDLGLREMRKILKMPNNGNKGANLPVIREKIKIFALIQNRNRGSIVQRIQAHTKTENVHIHTKTQEAPKSLDEIQREIRSIERSVGKLKLDGEVVEIEALTGQSKPDEASESIHSEKTPMAKEIDSDE